jgi:PAS domain S-box-containing protein
VVVGVIAATIVANLLGDRTIWSTIIFAVCNAGEAVLVAGLVERFFGPAFSMGRLRHVLGLVGAAIVSAAISGIGGTIGFQFHSSTAPALTTWQHWFTADALGTVTVAPLVIGLASSLTDPPSRRETIEGVVALALLAILSGAIFFLPRQPWATIVPMAALFPLLLGLAARCRPVFSAAAAFIIAFVVVWTTTFGIGIFGDANFPVSERFFLAQAGILAASLCSYVLAALFTERRQQEVVLRKSEARLQEALAAGAATAFDWDVRAGLSLRSANAAQILGFDLKQGFSAAQFLKRVHPDDRQRLRAVVRGLRSDSPSYVSAFRYLRPDGREVWLEETAKADFDKDGRIVQLSGLTVDITERKHAEERQNLLIAELDHRVKNVLARVAVVAMQTREGSPTIAQFVKALNGRIQSMAAAHSLLSQCRWQGVGISDLVRDQLAPYSTDANTTICGPNIMLTAAATQALAMVLHELVTNAAKYGALSIPDGHVSVTWDKPSTGDAAAKLTILWREIGSTSIAAPAQLGFGTSLIRDLIPHELGGRVDLVFGTNGIFCKIEIPL